ncbi:MAG TPA: beta-eliminating lyase-related protein [Steroidobacteraceae bacterium]|nr:beta-eliminating lyase-related protein [Steroidobacteraceae bacterium]
MRFFSDNTGTASAEILAALSDANHGLVSAYGNDPWTRRLDDCLSAYFGTQVRAFPVSTGTAANSLSLATLTPSYGVIFAHEEAHIANDEAGAPGFFSGGAQIELLQAPDGKVTHAALAAALEAHPVSLHTTQPTALALSQATELGTSYRPEELGALCKLAHDHGLKVQMDGARFANAVAFLDCHPGDVTWRAGVDILSFGATKNGALAAEAVVFFDTTLVRDFELRRKQSGHLLSKSRYVSAQLLAYVESGVWLRNARRTNDFARKIGRAGAELLMHPVEANEVFLALGQERKQTLRQAGFEFYDWNAASSGETRFVVSWDQREEDVLALCAALEKLS